MSFWDLGDGESVEDKKEFEAPSGGGDYLFADGTKVAAVIEEMGWTSFEGGEEFINVRWSVIAPETDADGVKIANRKVFQKLYPNGDTARNKDPEKAKKKAATAKRMLGAMASNAGGGLLKVEGTPSNDDFATHMLMKPMMIMLKVWEMDINGEKRSGNWIAAVQEYTGKVDAVGGAAKVEKKTTPASQGSALDDEIPFAPCM